MPDTTLMSISHVSVELEQIRHKDKMETDMQKMSSVHDTLNHFNPLINISVLLLFIEYILKHKYRYDHFIYAFLRKIAIAGLRVRPAICFCLLYDAKLYYAKLGFTCFWCLPQLAD